MEIYFAAGSGFDFIPATRLLCVVGCAEALKIWYPSAEQWELLSFLTHFLIMIITIYFKEIQRFLKTSLCSLLGPWHLVHSRGLVDADSVG